MFNGKKIHLIGIGGVSMSGIADILLSLGSSVTGYDMKKSDYTEALENKGIKISYEYNLDNIKDADIVVYTAAIKDDNEELKYAKSLNKELYERSVFLGMIMKQYKNVLCISGTHGKSTTTGMVSTIFLKNNMNPTIQIGAMLPLINSNSYVGGKEYFIAESCEFVDSFLDFFPTSEIILNIDNDHLDYFHNLDNIIASFKKFTELLPEDGKLVVNNDDLNASKASIDIGNKITYGINNNSKYMAKNIEYDEIGNPSYDLYIDNELITKVNLNIKGIHNVYNSLAAISLSHQYIDNINDIVTALEEYHGVERRFEFIGNYNNAKVFDDYAHHPSEIETTYNSLKSVKHKNEWIVFQSHTYSRTKDHLEEFANILSKFQNVIIAPIFPAREINIWNVKEDDLVKLINEQNGNAIYIDSFDKIIDYLKENVKEDDLVITIGAGPIDSVAKSLVENKK